jgi:hypothetical protein
MEHIYDYLFLTINVFLDIISSVMCIVDACTFVVERKKFLRLLSCVMCDIVL